MDTKIEAAYVRDEKFAKEYFSYHFYKRPSGIVSTLICILAIVSGFICLQFLYHIGTFLK